MVNKYIQRTNKYVQRTNKYVHGEEICKGTNKIVQVENENCPVWFKSELRKGFLKLLNVVECDLVLKSLYN
jgi:hypothetical protein